MDDEQDDGVETEEEGFGSGRPKTLPAFEWMILFFIALIVDGAQIFLDAAGGIGAFANRFVDLGFGFSLYMYLVFRGVKMDTKRTVSILGTFLAEAIPFIDAIPFWTGDIGILYAIEVIEKRAAAISPLAATALSSKLSPLTEKPKYVPPPPLPGSPEAKTKSPRPSLPGTADASEPRSASENLASRRPALPQIAPERGRVTERAEALERHIEDFENTAEESATERVRTFERDINKYRKSIKDTTRTDIPKKP